MFSILPYTKSPDPFKGDGRQSSCHCKWDGIICVQCQFGCITEVWTWHGLQVETMTNVYCHKTQCCVDRASFLACTTIRLSKRPFHLYLGFLFFNWYTIITNILKIISWILSSEDSGNEIIVKPEWQFKWSSWTEFPEFIGYYLILWC